MLLAPKINTYVYLYIYCNKSPQSYHNISVSPISKFISEFTGVNQKYCIYSRFINVDSTKMYTFDFLLNFNDKNITFEEIKYIKQKGI